MRTTFVQLFQYYTIRTMKAAVKNELTIPQQTRFLVPIELGRVERHVR
jgi:E3 ubiquitin-protein ligase SHPRH